MSVWFVATGLPAQAEVIVREKVKYYTVSGKNGEQIARSISRRGPKANRIPHAVASTFWDYKLKNEKYEVVGNRCKVTDVDVFVTLTYTYPKWSGYNRASADMKARWDKFIKLVVAHEEKHGKIFRDGSKGIERSLKRAAGSVSQNCKDYGRSLNRLLLPVVLRIYNRNTMFDRREGFRWAKVRIAQRLLEKGR